MPPLKLKPAISGKYVTTWYSTADALSHVERILVLGHSLCSGDTFINDMLRANRQAEIIINRDLEDACADVCTILQLSPQRCTSITVQGHKARKYDNRVTVVGAELTDVDLRE